MTTPIIQWPAAVLRVRDFSYFPMPVNRSGGRDLAGRSQVITSGEQIWNLRLDLTPDFDPDRVRQFDALVAQMLGRANIAQFDLSDPLRYSASFSPSQQPFSDGTLFSDDTGFGSADAVAPLVVTAGAAEGETTLSIRLSNPIIPQMRIGDHFSHGWFLYRVVAVSGAAVSFVPRARAAIAVDDVLSTDPVPVRMRFLSDEGGRSTREFGRWRKTLSLDFEEVFER